MSEEYIRNGDEPFAPEMEDAEDTEKACDVGLAQDQSNGPVLLPMSSSPL